MSSTPAPLDSEQAVLDWVNEQRMRYNLNGPVGPKGEPLAKLPTGRPGSEDRCVIARALDGKAGTSSAWVTRRGWFRRPERIEVKYPTFIRDFVHDFDAGCYPHLVDR